jgi:hypothetical protein
MSASIDQQRSQSIYFHRPRDKIDNYSFDTADDERD